MKKLYASYFLLVFFILSLSKISFGQNIAINTTSAAANGSALLDVGTAGGGDTKGMLLPRVSLSATNNNAPVGAFVNGLIVYNLATAGVWPNNVIANNFYYCDGTQWLLLVSGVNGGWSLSGNALSGASAILPNEWIGSSNDYDWVVKTNATERMRVYSTTGGSGNVLFHNDLGVNNTAPTNLIGINISGATSGWNGVNSVLTGKATNYSYYASSNLDVNTNVALYTKYGLYADMAATNSNAGAFGINNTGIYSYAHGSGAGGPSTNIAGYFSATSGTNNYAIIVPPASGNIGFGNSTPGTVDAAQFAGTQTCFNIKAASLPSLTTIENGKASASITSGDAAGFFAFAFPNQTANHRYVANIAVYADGTNGTGTMGGYISFQTKQNGVAQLTTERVGIGNRGDLYAWHSVFVDYTTANNGVINDGTDAGNALVFGQGSGEGIGSKRTATGNQFGLDFYTGFANRMMITSGGKVGINMAPSMQLDVTSASATASDAAIRGISTGTGVTLYGVKGTVAATANLSAGVYGVASGTGQVFGVLGQTSASTANNAAGVRGQAQGGTGDNYGVWGENNSTGGNASGVWGSSSALNGTGVLGTCSGTGNITGVWGNIGSTTTGATGVYGTATAGTGLTYGVLGANASITPAAAGVYGLETAASGQVYGVKGQISSTTTNASGVFGNSIGGTGATNGVWGANTSTTAGAAGVYGSSTGGAGTYGGYFTGNVNVAGTLTKTAGAFMIDHPLDPANKYLIHSFVESPDMLNIYNGNIITNDSGEAIVELPSYFQAENMDYKYQLTCIGQFAQAIILKKVSNNMFVIKTNKSQVEVSWQVTGVRNDEYAKKYRLINEVEKTGAEKGKYRHPELYGFGDDMSIDNALKNSKDGISIRNTNAESKDNSALLKSLTPIPK